MDNMQSSSVKGWGETDHSLITAHSTTKMHQAGFSEGYLLPTYGPNRLLNTEAGREGSFPTEVINTNTFIIQWCCVLKFGINTSSTCHNGKFLCWHLGVSIEILHQQRYMLHVPCYME